MEETINQPSSMFVSLLAVQKALTTITKNKKGYSGNYADIENVWESIRQVIAKNKFVVYHLNVFVDGAYGVKTVALHESGDYLSSFIPFSAEANPQDKGKEITYYKRYNIGAIFNLIIADEDNDANKEKGNYKKKDVDGSLAAGKLLAAKTPEEGNQIYSSLSKEERNTTEVIQAIAKVKDKFQK